ncbi:MAG: preprotein translocase subunit YajC [Clostridia bacterium]|nr:preprotein translocase subunit YajC [Clostridia bacterium]
MFDFFKVLAEEAGANGGATPDGGGNNTNSPMMLIILGVIFVAFIIMSVIQNKKQKKQMAEEQAKKDKLCAGTTVITIGGVMGVVTEVNNDENSFVLNTQGTLMKFDKRAIYQMTLPESAKEEVEEVKETK